MKRPKTILSVESCHRCTRKILCKRFGEEGYICREHRIKEVEEDDSDLEFGWCKINYDLI